MRREWPLLVGLVASAALVFWSTTLGAPVGPKPDAGPTRVAQVPGGSLDDVPAAETPRAQGGRGKGHDRPKDRKPADAKGGPGTGGGADSDPAPSPSGAGTGRTPSGSGGSGSPKPEGQETVPLVVAVTGNEGEITRGNVTITCGASGHSPVSGRDWTLNVSAVSGTRAPKGEVSVDVVHQGKVVGHIHTGPLKRGVYTHTVQWPPESVGHPLTVKVSVDAGGESQTFLYKIRVRPA